MTSKERRKLLSSTSSFSKPIAEINPKKWLETRIRTVSWYEKNSNGEWKRCWRSIGPEETEITTGPTAQYVQIEESAPALPRRNMK